MRAISSDDSDESKAQGIEIPVQGNRYKEQDLYAALGVSSRYADESEIRRCYRKSALIYHPDKGGNTQQWQELQTAAEVLLDPKKRAVYDKDGLGGLATCICRDSLDESPSLSPCMTSEEMYQHFFHRDSYPPFANHAFVERGESITYPLRVGLSDLYLGKELKVAVKRQRPCIACVAQNQEDNNGNNCGSSSNVFVRCDFCQGSGRRLIVKQTAVGSVDHVSSSCVDCNGSGRRRGVARCRVCNGSRVTNQRVVLPVRIERGSVDGGKIKFAGEGAQPAQDHVPGDVCVVLKQANHDTFVRAGNDLRTSMKISLHESLCGYERTITHLDGRVLRVVSMEGEVTKPGSIYVLDGEGMPVPGHQTRRGRLFVEFEVIFPDSMPLDVVQELRKVIPEDRATSASRAMSIGNDDDDSDVCRDSPLSIGSVKISFEVATPVMDRGGSVGVGEGRASDEPACVTMKPYTPEAHEPIGAFMEKELLAFQESGYDSETRGSVHSQSSSYQPGAQCEQQ